MSNIPCPVYHQSVKNPNNTACIFQNRSYSYEELHRDICRLTEQLHILNISPSSNVGVYHRNSYSFIVLLFSLWRIQATACLFSKRLPINSLLKLADETGCRHILTDNESLKSESKTHLRFHKLTDLINAEEEYLDNIIPNVSMAYKSDAFSTLMYTSGSSDKPKAVVHTFLNHFCNAQASNEHIPLSDVDKWLITIPMYHVGGLAIVFRCFLAGASCVINQDQSEIIDDITLYDISHISVVDTQMRRLMKHPKADQILGKLNTVLIGGGPVSDSVIQYCQTHNIALHLTYGMTEASSQIATSPSVLDDQFNRTVWPLKPVYIKLSDKNEILVKGNIISDGYYINNEVHSLLDNDGWFHTRDCGELTAKGGLRIVGRLDNMFISGGENIQPEEIEQHLIRIPQIVQAMVLPQADKEFGYRPIAIIKSESPCLKLSTLLDNDLPKFKIPSNYYRWPKNTKQSMKPSRKEMNQLLKNNELIKLY